MFFFPIEKALTEIDGANAPFSAVQSKRYIDFVKKISQIERANAGETSSQDVDEDLLRMPDRIIDIDPITKQPLENPVRNRQCGHIYGKESVMESLQINSRLR